MAKYSRCEDDVQTMVRDIAAERGLDQFMEFEALYVAKAKEVVTISKASAIAEYLSNRDDLILVFIYAEAFDLVDDKTKYMWLSMALDQVSFDSEKDKILIGCPMISVPVGFYQKYEKVAIDTALLGQLTIQQIEDKKREEKERQKAEKALKKGKKHKGE